MTRTTAWLSFISCAALLAAVSIGGCGSSTPANNGKGGSGGSRDGGAGAGGAGGGTAGAAGDNGIAGSTAGSDGGVAGAAGGTAGADGGTAGAAGGTDGGTAGAAGATTDGGSDVASDVKSEAGGDTASDMSSDVPPTPCVEGGSCSSDFSCSITRTCRRNQEQLCFCAPNGKIACEPCDTTDAGTDAGSDAGGDAGADAGTDGGGTDGGIAMCPANVISGTTACSTALDRCAATACTNNRQRTCVCFNPAGGDNANHWYCQNTRCQ
jgi:hypothetical protein